MTEKQHFGVQKVYIKDLSFESPNSLHYFTSEIKPKINLELNTQIDDVGEDTYEVVLSITVTANNTGSEDVVMYLVEVKQSGIFKLTGFDNDDKHRLLHSHCPSILFPFAREVISSAVEKAGFPQLLLAPINFEGLYEQHLAQLHESKNAPPKDERH